MTKANPKKKSELIRLRTIGLAIKDCWVIDPPSESVVLYATPYLNAICSIDYTTDEYGLDHGDIIVAYLLSNIQQWRGGSARMAKADLKDHLDWHNGGKPE